MADFVGGALDYCCGGEGGEGDEGGKGSEEGGEVHVGLCLSLFVSN